MKYLFNVVQNRTGLIFMTTSSDVQVKELNKVNKIDLINVLVLKYDG